MVDMKYIRRQFQAIVDFLQDDCVNLAKNKANSMVGEMEVMIKQNE